MFNEFQIGLLKQAHERIAEKNERFLCCAISTATQMPDKVDYVDRVRYGNRLKDAIDFGISGYVCFEVWLFSEIGVYPEDINENARESWDRIAKVGWQRAMPREEYNNLCRVCRMTWIEHAIETGSLL